MSQFLAARIRFMPYVFSFVNRNLIVTSKKPRKDFCALDWQGHNYLQHFCCCMWISDRRTSRFLFKQILTLRVWSVPHAWFRWSLRFIFAFYRNQEASIHEILISGIPSVSLIILMAISYQTFSEWIDFNFTTFTQSWNLSLNDQIISLRCIVSDEVNKLFSKNIPI